MSPFRGAEFPIREPVGEWADNAACKGMESDLWFPTGVHKSEFALQVCSTCPVREECAEYAIPEARLQGIWGGLDYNQRERIRSRRRRGLKVAVDPVLPWRDTPPLTLEQRAARAAFGHE